MIAQTLLTEAQRTVAARVLAEESARRDHVVIYLSGAHAYGFPSPDSDLDLKAVHVARTGSLLGFAPPAPTFDRAEIIDGVEIDYTSNELAAALLGVTQGNGNFIERFLGTCTMQESEWLPSARPLVKRALSRRVHRHYRGFATSQVKALEATPTVKKLLYVLRTTLTGTHLLATGELVADVTELLDRYGFAEARALVQAKRAGERTSLDAPTLDRWRGEIQRAFDGLDAAVTRSVLPEEPPNVDELEAWLVELRKNRL